MRVALTLICLVLLAASDASAQDAASKAQASPELEEAARLNKEVLKLFGERKFDEALPLAKRVVEIRERLVPESMPLAYALGNLGAIYTQKGKGGDAEPLLRRSLAILEKQG